VNLLRLLIVALVAFIGANLCAQTPGAAPKLAIINQHRDPAVADLLFAKLSASGGFALVERDQFARIVKELELTSFSRENNVRAGQLVSADALLFVEPEKTLLHLRLVETHRGERIADAVYPLEKLDLDAIASTTQAQLEGLARKLRTPPADRIYLALAPITTFGRNAVGAETLGTLSTLIGVRLIQNDRVIVVERDNLASVVAEKDLSPSREKLASAEIVVRGRVVTMDADRLDLEFQLQSTRDAEPAAFGVQVERTKLAEGAETVAAKIAKVLGLTAPAAGTSLAAEAQRHFLIGLTMLHAQLFEPALRSLETACLLDPPNKKSARAFVDGVVLCLEEQVGRGSGSGRTMAAEDYLFYIDRLRAALAVARQHDPTISSKIAESWRIRRFLIAKNEQLDADDRAQLAACRTELREVIERFSTNTTATDKKRQLGDWAPLFFDEPRAALAYFKSIVAAGGYPWSGLRDHVFPYIDYWDAALARKLWSEFLDEVARDPSLDAQFSAVAARCYFNEAFPNSYSGVAVRGKGREAAQQLFAWLAAQPENLEWVLAHENWYIFLRLWHALLSLPLDEQDRYFESVMLKVLAQARGSEHDAFNYLSARYIDGITNQHAPQDAPQIRRHLDQALATLAVTNPKLHREWLANLPANKWLSTLMDNAKIPEPAMPEVPGGVLLYDSARTEPAIRTFDNFNGLADGDVLWLAHTKAKAIVVTRVEMTPRTSETFEFAVEGSGQSAFERVVLARSPRYLFVADKYRVLAIPVAEKAPFLSSSAFEIIGPRFGADETAGIFEREFSDGRESFRRITAVIPAGEDLYIALDQRTHDYSNRYGAIYRWRPGARDCELICASDSLKSGPLNDCLPYSVAGGCASADGSAIYFFLAEVERQPAAFAEGQRRGAWKFTPASGQWERLREGGIGSLRRRPVFVSRTIFDLPGEGGNDRFNLETLEIARAVGDISGADARRGWVAKLAIDSQVRYQRLYRVDGKQSALLFSLSGREFEIGPLIPTDQGLIVLLSGLQTGKPTTRGLVYLLPQEK
jgi:hypothetical protein